jgi:hypothetical protein
MAYPKAKLKSEFDKLSPYFQPFLIGNMSDNSFAYPDSAIGSTETFLLALLISWRYQVEREYKDIQPN